MFEMTPYTSGRDKLWPCISLKSPEGNGMASFELNGTLKALKVEQARAQKELAKLGEAITVLSELSRTRMGVLNGIVPKRILSAAARNKIAKAQRLRWAKVRKQQAAKP